MGEDLTGFQLFGNEVSITKDDLENEGIVIDEEFAVETNTEEPLEYHDLSLDEELDGACALDFNDPDALNIDCVDDEFFVEQ